LNSQEKDTAARCERATAQLTWSLAALLAMQLALGLSLAGGVGQGSALKLLGAVWLAWLATLVSNYRLVGCGPVGVRFRDAPRFVNRPDFSVRLALHVLVNWSPIAVTVGVAWLLRETSTARALAWLAIGAAAAMWLEFNVLHRRMNRARNLAMSSLMAAILVFACAALLR